jgi:hypothetical protein
LTDDGTTLARADATLGLTETLIYVPGDEGLVKITIHRGVSN